MPGNLAGYYVLGLAAAIPGYVSYGKADKRRNADRELRRHIVSAIVRLKGVAAAVAARGTHETGAVDVIRRLDEIQKEIEEPGTTLDRFFGAGDLSEAEVDEIHAYDRRIVDALEELERAAASTAPENWTPRLDRMETLVDGRAAAITQVAPSP